MKCPHCDRTTRQNKAGRTTAGSQRYQCLHCRRKYTPEPKARGYPGEIRKQALQMYVDGINLRKIGRHLGIHHCTISLWVKAYAQKLAQPPLPKQVTAAELDELFTFVGDKKTGSTF